MEPIKITDKLTLRQEALRMALQTLYGVNVSENLKDLVLKRAKDLAEYIQGSADLPERDNAMEKYLLELKDSVLNFKNNPWISADSEMKPALNTQVLVWCEDYTTPLFGEYLGGDYWEVEEADVTLLSKDGDVNVVAWSPIPPYVAPPKL